ncbi:MAG TPA: hypothetical protein VNY05_14920 [Candidatus Acidoferrales bacterium]|nr:hypothetical protein [Candidatus Acidoferrales bacterium]
MSDFLVNLVRRGAGLPVGTIQAPVPFAVEAPLSNGPAVGVVPGAPPITGAPEMTRPEAQAPPAHQAIARVAAPARSEPVMAPAAALAPAVTVAPSPPAATVTSPPSVVAPAGRTAMEPRIEASEGAVALVAEGRPLPDGRATSRRSVRGREYSPGSSIGLLPPEPQIIAGAHPRIPASIEAVSRQAQGHAIRPALADSAAAAKLPRVSPSALQPAIHVHIGRVEVRAQKPAAPPPQPAKAAPVAPLGFARYTRQRTYRNWPL